MAINQEGWSASAELNKMRKNPLFNQLRAESTLNTGRYGNLQQDVANYQRMSLGREQLNKFSNNKKELYIPDDNIGPAVNRRTGAATGNNAEWAWPKIHDPFEWFRERCILPGEEVTLLEGPKKVEDITYGEQALTHKGRYRRVLDIGNQEYEGKVYELKPRYRTSINVTADHPIWTQRDNENGGEFVHVQDLTTNDKILFPVDRRIEDKEFINLTEIIDHSDLIIENGYFTRKLSEGYSATPKRASSNGKVGRPISSLPVEIELTDDFLWFLGLYIAEGSTGGPENKTVSISLSTKETDLIDKTVRVLEKLTGKIATVRDHTKYGDNSVNIALTNIPLSRALPVLCGKGSYNKHFPTWAMFLPEDKQKALLRGYFDGDGCYQPDITSCFTSSKHLHDQILHIMARNGFFPSVYKRTTKSFSKNTEGKNIVLSRTENDQFLAWLDIHQFDDLDNDDTIIKRGRKYPIEYVNEGVWVPVEEIIESDYKGLIYSLTITEDHSYCVSGIATRNTWWFNMEDPDEQTRKIRDWCSSPEAPIIMADYTIKPIGEIKTGDEVLGWDKNNHLVNSKVLATKTRTAPEVVEATMTSGKKIKCTPDHKWYNVRVDRGEDQWITVVDDDVVLTEIDPITFAATDEENRLLQYGNHDKVENVKSLGPGPVVSMQTETGNYIAWGYASKNCRLIYTTHYLVPSMIDIYSRFPLLGMEFAYPDKRVNEFFSELFWDGLQYQDFLYSLSREHWLIGDVFALGSWNDGIGAWEADELINPNDVVVAKNRALRTYQYHIKVPEEVKKLVETRQPEKEFAMLMAMYPDVVEYARKDVEIPVSDVIMKGIPYRTNPWAEHGTPILMRAFRQLMMEESLMASMEAISDRLYSPLILATLGLPDADGDGPWIPDAEELGQLRDDLAMAINADFRLMVYHHGLEIQNAFGRESMPNLDKDFYRIQSNYMMVFGIGSELLQGGKSGATYASGALNRELITQMLTTHQHQIKHFIQGRMRAVAERQGFYEYRNVGGHPVPIMETVLVVDEETGAQFVEERPKLAIPDIIFQSMSLQDENVEHQFLQQLAGMGLPVSFQTFTRNAGLDFEDEIETVKREKVDLVIAEQQVKKDIFDRCFQLQLPIPMEYQAEYEAYIMQLQDPQLAEQLRPGAIQGLASPAPTPNIGGTPVHTDVNGIPNMYPSIANQETLDTQKKHPPESHEQKKTQPKQSKSGKPNGPQKKTASVEDHEMLVTSKKTGEDFIIEEGAIVSNVGEEGGEWGKYRKSNPKQASVTEEFDGEREITYGDRMKFSVPWESQYRTQMKLANGQKIVIDDNYEKYDALYMKNHIAKILESNVVGPEDDDFNDKLNEQTIPTNMDFDHHKSDMMGFDMPAITGVNPEDMGPKVTFGSQEFPNRKKPNNKKDEDT